MTTTTLDAKNISYGAEDNSVILADVQLPRLASLGYLPMALTASYDTAEGQDVYARIVNGEFGAIAAFVGPNAAQQLESAQAVQIASLAAECQSAIITGFTSNALGSAHTYPSTDTDQRNLLSAATVSQAQAPSWTTSLWCACGSPVSWSLTEHTAAQVQQVNADWLAFRVAAQQKYADLLQQLSEATTVSAVQAVVWS